MPLVNPLVTEVIQQEVVVRSVWNEWSCSLSVIFSYVDLKYCKKKKKSCISKGILLISEGKPYNEWLGWKNKWVVICSDWHTLFLNKHTHICMQAQPHMNTNSWTHTYNQTRKMCLQVKNLEELRIQWVNSLEDNLGLRSVNQSRIWILRLGTNELDTRPVNL